MKATILIVDDEQAIRDMLQRHYRLEGWNTRSAANGKEALDIIASEPITVVISDILMPVMNGIELLKHIRDDFSMTKVIIITGYVSLDYALSCMRYGAVNCIFKPLNSLEELDTAVNRALADLNLWQEKFLYLKGLKNTSTEE